MVGDIFVIVQGIDGESSDAVYAKSIEAFSWHLTMSQESTMHSGSGGGSGKASVPDLHFVHAIDRASPNLIRHACTGRHVPHVKLVQRKAGGVPLDFLTLTLDDVVVTNVEQACARDIMIEHVTLSFARLTQAYVVQGASGGSLGVVTAQFDIKQNRAS
jgi:type VI secretion system secreted protein Hcp